MNWKEVIRIIKRKNSLEEIKRHSSFTKVFLPLYIFLGVLIFWFTKMYNPTIMASSLIAFSISSFMPDVLFLLQVFLEVDEPYFALRKKTHSFSYSLIYFLFLSFCLTPIFGLEAFVVSFSALLGYWLHLFVDKLEDLMELFEKILKDVLSWFMK